MAVLMWVDPGCSTLRLGLGLGPEGVRVQGRAGQGRTEGRPAPLETAADTDTWICFAPSQPTLLMPIIQFVLPSKDKRIKKLLHFYWEICPKLDENGKLKQEMILVWCVLCLAVGWACRSWTC